MEKVDPPAAVCDLGDAIALTQGNQPFGAMDTNGVLCYLVGGITQDD